MNKQILTLTLLVALGIPMLSGCVLLVGAAAGGAGIAFIKGSLEKNFDYPVVKLHKAILSAMKDLKAQVVEDKLAEHNSKTKVHFSDGKDATIEVEALTEKSSRLKVRVGIFGDEAQSQMILSAIQKRL